jgi:phosphocarrier protein
MTLQEGAIAARDSFLFLASDPRCAAGTMQERRVRITNRLGLHARASARLVRRATQFTSRIELERDDTRQCADGKSILSVLLLAASRDSFLIIRAEGEDEERAANALAELVEQRFGEELSDGVF